MKEKKASLIIILIVLLAILSIPLSVYSTSGVSLGVANYVPIEDKTVREGDIVSFSPKGYRLSKNLYDQTIVGVVTLNPAIVFDVKENGSKKKRYPIISSGRGGVNVSTVNGFIKRGDFITSSQIPGVGIKSTKSGFVVGTALADYNSQNTQAVKKIKVAIDIKYVGWNLGVLSNLFELLNVGAIASAEEPVRVFRYMLAAIIIVSSFLLGFFAFGKAASRGIEALGRNPLAGKTIQFGIIVNVVITLVIVVAGIVVAFFILTV